MNIFVPDDLAIPLPGVHTMKLHVELPEGMSKNVQNHPLQNNQRLVPTQPFINNGTNEQNTICLRK